MKKVLIFGPIGNFGGRELEVGYIANVLSELYHVEICTTGLLDEQSQIFSFNPSLIVHSINKLIYRNNWVIRVLAFISYLKNGHHGAIYNYSSNRIAKKHFKFDHKVRNVLRDLVTNCDLIFICAQLSSYLIKEIVDVSVERERKIIFRTTGLIRNVEFDYLDKIDCFVHHSRTNAIKLSEKGNFNYKIIDQTSFNEEELINLPNVNRKVKTFITLARLTKDKNIDIVISAFLNSKRNGELLYVIGDGTEYSNLVKLANGAKEVIFTGFISHDKLVKYFSIVDCVIISYYEFETGPLTGVEAMAASRLIISTKSGAMQERIPEVCFWFENSKEQLIEQMNVVRNLREQEVLEISKKIRQRYLNKYLSNSIKMLYLEVVSETLGFESKSNRDGI